MAVGRMAAEAGLRVAPHSWSDAIAIIANAHVVAALPNGLTVEVDRSGNPFVDDLLKQPFGVHDGLLTLSDAPGLGVEIDMAVIDRLRLPADQPIPEGSYSDLIFGQAHLMETPSYSAA
jgi:L-alanine-DL-glutamate epimerase-like enolase superfamily enzyme